MEEVVGGHRRGSQTVACPPLPTSPQDNASKLLLALMESRHDSENAERILISLRPQELVRLGPGVRWERRAWLGCRGTGIGAFPTRQEGGKQALPCQVDVIKKAYLQEEERENSEVSPREVGHNIYILALQVPAPPLAPPPAVLPSPPPQRPRPVTAPPSPSALQAQQAAAAPAQASEAHPRGGGRGHLFYGGGAGTSLGVGRGLGLGAWLGERLDGLVSGGEARN